MTVRGDAVRLPRLAQVQRAAELLERHPDGPGRLVGVAVRVLGVRFGFLSLLDDVEETFTTVVGPPDRPFPRALPRAASVCQYLVGSGAPLLVEDLAEHPQLRLLQEVRRFGLRSYAGVPVRSADGTVLGGFCVADEVPRSWSEEDSQLLEDLASAQAAELQLRTALEDLERASARDRARAAQGAALHRVARAVAAARPPDDVLALAAQELRRLPGILAAAVVRGRAQELSVVASAGGVPDDLLAGAAPALERAERCGRAASLRLRSAELAVVPLSVADRHWGSVLLLAQDPPTPAQLERLRDLVGLVVGTADAQERLLDLARSDPLTGVLNRRGFDERLGAELERDRRSGGALTLALLDVDRFKEVNDLLGHAGGDAVLRALVDRLRLGLRVGDVLGRPGGDEFALLLPGTDAPTATAVLGRLRAQVADAPLAGTSVTVSVGAATTTDGRTPAATLATLADRALYAVKERGRNAVRVVDAGRSRPPRPPTAG